jgi:transcriptional regulator with XRE-family HTH domain
MTFAEKLKQLREKAGLTQSALASATGLGLGTIRDYEQGKKEPTLRSAARLAAALGATVEEFVGTLDAEPGQSAPRSMGRPPKPAPPPAGELEATAKKPRARKGK